MKLQIRFIAPDSRTENDIPTALVKDDKVIAHVFHEYYAAMFCLAEEMRSLLVIVNRRPCDLDGQNRHASDCGKCAAAKLLLKIDLEEARLLGARRPAPPQEQKRCRVSEPA